MKKLAAAVAAMSAIGLFSPAPASALPAGCVQQPWLVVLRMTVRTICDSPMYGDGTWTRRRLFYAPESWVPVSCSRYSCWGGYWLQEYVDLEEYPVTPDTVLPDEPGWITN